MALAPAVWWGWGLLFGNCIVDASICSDFLCCWVSFVCLSVLGRMVDALAAGADEGRGNLR